MDPLFQQLRDKLATLPGRTLQGTELGLREAAVLVPLLWREDGCHILFTKRPTTLRTHAGQISFPGGSKDPEDASPLETALRETHEELGVPREQVTVLGSLDETTTITRYRVTPFVGVLAPGVVYEPSPVEIEEVLEVPLRHLMNPAYQRTEQWGEREMRDMYFFDWGRHIIWGATARILRSLLQVGMDLPSFQSLRAQ